MREGKFANRKGVASKTLVMVLALVMVVGCTVGGTLAWLTDTTEAKVNTFTVGNIDIDLTETTVDYKMVPGTEIAKDPKVTVTAGSEDSWVFVKIDESTNLADFITYAVADGWTALKGVSGVYYRQQAATNANVTYRVLKDDKVAVKNTVTKDMMDAITNGTATNPTLTFTAYAIQSANLADQNDDGIVDAADAWALLDA